MTSLTKTFIGTNAYMAVSSVIIISRVMWIDYWFTDGWSQWTIGV